MTCLSLERAARVAVDLVVQLEVCVGNRLADHPALTCFALALLTELAQGCDAG